MQKILVIGSEGYLGTKLSNFLNSKNYDCTGLDTGFFKKSLLYNEINYQTKFLDIRKISEKYIKKFNVIIFLAGISNNPVQTIKSTYIYEHTRKYTYRIAELSKKYGIKFIFSSSCSVYGVSNNLCNENTKPNPQTGYSKNKIDIEKDLQFLADKNFTPIILRLATLFGISPRMRFDIMINMICGMAITKNKILLNSNGQSWRPHLYIDDACDAFKCAIDKKFYSKNAIILNVGLNKNNMKILDVANLVKKNFQSCNIEFLQNKKNNLFQDKNVKKGIDKRTYKVNFDKIRLILPEFNCKWNIDKGIKILLKDLKKIKINEKKFIKKEFYRLQFFEHLIKTNKISKNFYWKNK